jgi:putative flippase GtrA
MNSEGVPCLSFAQTTGRHTLYQFVRFLFVSGSFAGIYILCTTFLLQQALLPAWGASALVYGLCIVPAYLAQKKFAFQSCTPNINAFPRYLILQFASLLFASATAEAMHSIWLLPALYISIASIGIAVIGNFFLLKLWVLADYELS